MMRKLLVLAALGSLAFAPAAHATLESLTFVGYGGGYQPPTPPPGESLITDFSSSAGLTGSYLLETGTTGDYAAPAYSTTARDPNQYLAIEGGDTATLSLGKSYTGVEIYLGSLDSYNAISFSNGLSFTGADLAAYGAVDNGDQQSISSNGLFYFLFSPDEAVHSVTFSSTTNALEIAGVSASSAVPEPSTWAMLLMGFAGLGYAARRKTRTAVSIV
jgi:PEP-CTERM motif